MVLATSHAIDSQEVAKEIDEAKRLGKRIVPCKYKSIEWFRLERLGIGSTHGPEFDAKEDLVRKLEERKLTRASAFARQKNREQDKTRPTLSNIANLI